MLLSERPIADAAADVDSPVKGPIKARKAKRVIESDDEDEEPVMKSPSKKENAGGKSEYS